MRKLMISTGTSKGRDTYGYTIVRLRDSETGKLYRTMGGGYDMVGTVLADWLQDVHQDRLREIADRAYAAVEDGHYSTSGDLYGMTDNRDAGLVTLDGACGVESIRRIAEAAGVELHHIPSKSGRTEGWYADV